VAGARDNVRWHRRAATPSVDAAMPNQEIVGPLATSPMIAFLATANAARSRQFYEHVLQLRLTGDEVFALVFECNGTMLRIQKVESVRPVPYTSLGWQTEDISQLVQQLTDRGVQFDRYQGLEQDELGIWTSPAGARVAWFKDPDGNILSLTQFGSSPP
jgi:catechol 2,3-dioxygenase-like lactoylglutathione lyase family enzyme